MSVGEPWPTWPTIRQGWQCPKCGQINSPDMSWCPNHGLDPKPTFPWPTDWPTEPLKPYAGTGDVVPLEPTTGEPVILPSVFLTEPNRLPGDMILDGYKHLPDNETKLDHDPVIEQILDRIKKD